MKIPSIKILHKDNRNFSENKYDSQKNEISSSHYFLLNPIVNIEKSNNNNSEENFDLKFYGLIKGKSKFFNSLNESKNILNFGLLTSNIMSQTDSIIILRDITHKDKNINSFRFGLIRKLKLDFNKNYINNKTNDEFKNHIQYPNNYSSNFYDIHLGFMVDRAIYPKNESYSDTNICSRNYLKLLFGFEKENLSILYKLKYNNFCKNELLHKGYVRYLINNYSNLKVNFSYCGKNDKLKYYISSSIKINPTTKIDVLLEKNYLSKVLINSKLNDRLSINFNVNFNINDNINIPKMRLGFGLNYDFDDDFFPKNKQNCENNSNEYYFFDRDNERGINLKDFKNFFYATVNNIRNIFNSIDIY
jgi:hypothetical protein